MLFAKAHVLRFQIDIMLKKLICIVGLLVINSESDKYLKSLNDLDYCKTVTSATDIHTKKRILLDLGLSGLGNRLLAIASTSVMALMMDRVIEIDWKRNTGCDATFENLFHPASARTVVQPFVSGYQTKKAAMKTIEKVEKQCRIHLDGAKDENGNPDYLQFHLVNNTALFKRLDDECDVIYIKANIYYTHLLYSDPIHALSHNRKKFDRPFYHISNILFRPQKQIMHRIQYIMKKKFDAGNKNSKWLSIQARGKFTFDFFDDALTCANLMLTRGQVEHVFFATDDSNLKDKANSFFTDKTQLFTIEKELVRYDKDKDNMAMRQSIGQMDIALLEWYLVGEATYCMSPSIDESTFSKTAIARGNCIYLSPSEIGDCLSTSTKAPYNAPTKMVDKEYVLFHTRGLHEYKGPWLDAYIPHIKDQTYLIDHVWKSVQIENTKEREQCIPDHVPASFIEDYWDQGPG